MRRAVPKEPIPFREYTPHVVPPTSSELTARIERIQQEIIEYVDKRVAELKAGRDGADLPIESLRRMLIRGECPCAAALRLLNEYGYLTNKEI
jgi:hypothetical protein